MPGPELFTAFEGLRRLVSGPLAEVALVIKRAERRASEPVAIFSDATGRAIDLDLRGSDEQILARLPQDIPAETALPNPPREAAEVFALPSRAASSSGMASPVAPRPPMRRKSRREIPSHRRQSEPRRFSMRQSPATGLRSCLPTKKVRSMRVMLPWRSFTETVSLPLRSSVTGLESVSSQTPVVLLLNFDARF